jgi:RimJ/RimL family protein N-acetyltransferase
MFFQFVEQLNRKCPMKGSFFMPFSPAHTERLHVTQPEIVAASKFIDISEAIINQASLGPAVTAFYGSQPVACFGFVPIWTGVGEAWLIADDKARSKPIGMTKMAKLFFDILQISYELHRVQIAVRTSDTRAHKWALFLGFKEEGIMRRYGPDGADHYIMARCK